MSEGRISALVAVAGPERRARPDGPASVDPRADDDDAPEAPTAAGATEADAVAAAPAASPDAAEPITLVHFGLRTTYDDTPSLGRGTGGVRTDGGRPTRGVGLGRAVAVPHDPDAVQLDGGLSTERGGGRWGQKWRRGTEGKGRTDAWTDRTDLTFEDLPSRIQKSAKGT